MAGSPDDEILEDLLIERVVGMEDADGRDARPGDPPGGQVPNAG